MAGSRESRNTGVDLLRIIAMLMVTTIHILGHGGVIASTVPFSVNYEIAWALETVVYCAVDIYIMITGFVYANKEVRVYKVLQLWCSVFFYSVMVPICLKISGYSIGAKEFASSFFPLLRKQYWFFNSYFALLFFVPALNKLLVNKKLLLKVLLSSFILFSFLPILGLGNDLFNTNGGYSFLWFTVLYLCGGYLKVYGVPAFISLKNYWTVFIVSVLTMLLSRNILMLVTGAILDKPRGELLYSYTSPFVVMCAFCLLVLFSQANISHRLYRAIYEISALTFGVYLIHDNPNFRAQVIKNSFTSYVTLPAWLFFTKIVATVVAVFTICVVVEYLRSKLFLLLRISKVLYKVEGVLTKICSKSSLFQKI